MSAYNSRIPIFRNALNFHKPQFYNDLLQDMSLEELVKLRAKYMARAKWHNLEKCRLTWRAVNIVTAVICRRKGI